MRIWITALLLIILSSSAYAIDYSTVNPLVEIRGIWMDAGAIPKTEQGIRELVRSYAKSNLNVLFPEVVARGYTVYKSDLLARDPRFAGAIDPLPIIIDEAHKLGMEVHPWVWVFRAGYTADRGAILTAHPDWAELSKYGEDLSPGGGMWISPCIPEAQNFLICLYSELVSKYDVDGIHLDYVRYENESPISYGYNPRCRAEFERKYGIDPVDVERVSINKVEWNRFRERQVNTFVQKAAMTLRAINQNLKISAAVASDPVNARLSFMQNWVNWVDNRWVDFLTPMNYTANNDTFRRFVVSQQEAVDNRTLLAPGLGLHIHKENVTQTIEQIAIARELYASGQTIFASSYYKEAQQQALACGPYSTIACLPFRDPWNKSMMICDYAAQFSRGGSEELAGYFGKRANDLAEYAKYQQAEIGYIPPSPVPLEIPEVVVPLPEVRVPATNAPVTIDGALTEPAWQRAAQVQLKYNNEGEPALVETTAYLMYDTESLYIGFRSQEPVIGSLKATVDKRDGPTFYDDSVEVFVDPTDARRDYYHLSTNTLGTRFDQKVFNVGWNAEWTTASQAGQNEWTTEIAIPFTAFSVSTPAPGTKWALNLTRNRTTGGEMQYLTWAVPYGSFHSPDRFGTIVFGE